jgi:Glycosyltransferase family 10 (fucosyltransferase) C-term
MHGSEINLSSSAPSTNKPIRVKFVAKGHQKYHQDIFLRQFPGRRPVWGRCEFDFDPDAKEYDWLAVYDDLPPVEGERFSTRAESLSCAAQHTLFITMEPSSIKTYGHDFLDQFGVIVTSQEPWAITNQQAVFTQPALRWFYGDAPTKLRTWDQMVLEPPDNKTLNLSAVCSNKQQKNTVHADRYAFTMRLKQLIPEMGLFGRGVCPIDDKADALDSFRYHIAIENHICPHHWTEKLADAFLGLTLPFYYGCPNAAEYFPADSFVSIDIHQPEAAAARISQAIADNEFERRLPAIREARRRVLEQYNLFAVVADHVERGFDASRRLVPGAELVSRHRSRRRSVMHTLRFSIERMKIQRRHRQMKRQRTAA